MRYKLLALDIDGTLLNSKSQLTPRTVAAVRAAAQSGLKVCLVSGRRARSMATFATELGISDPMVCCNGGTITLPGSFLNLHAERIPKAVVVPIIRAWEAAGISVFAFRDTNELPDIYFSGMSNWPPEVHYIQREGGNIQQVCSLVASDWDPLRINVRGDEMTGRKGAALADPLIDPTKLRVIFTQYYDGPWFYEIYSAAATKSNGLRWLGEHFGIRREEMIAVGDHVNDLDMIEYAGLGVAMGNAQPEVKAIADLVIGHHDQDGLAVFIEEQLLGSGADGSR